MTPPAVMQLRSRTDALFENGAELRQLYLDCQWRWRGSR